MGLDSWHRNCYTIGPIPWVNEYERIHVQQALFSHRRNDSWLPSQAGQETY